MLNPISYTEKVISDFLKYQLTAYPFADSHLYAQMRQLLNLEETRRTPLFQGPYISLSSSFRKGLSIAELINQGILHPYLQHIAPYPNVYGHQETAIRAIIQGKTTLVSTGTGSGKTECFLYPIISHCLHLRDEQAPPGIVAVIVYPMNALAEDQLGRLRDFLAGSGVTFGMYVGKTPEKTADAPGKRLKKGASHADYQKALEKAQNEKQAYAVYPPEEKISREEMRKTPPQILLTNIKQLELLLTRQQDVELFDNAQLDYLVFDEAHTFTGAVGAETACLIRRLRSFCGKTASETTCIATSATLTDPQQGKDIGRNFASRFFGVTKDSVILVSEEYELDLWETTRHIPQSLPDNPASHLKNILTAVEAGEQAGFLVNAAFQAMTGNALEVERWQESLYQQLAVNELVYQLNQALKTPRLLSELIADLERRVGRVVPEAEVLAWLALGAASRQNHRPLLRPVVHGFVRGVGGAVVTFSENSPRPQLWLSAGDVAEQADNLFRLAVTTCTTCGQHYFIHHLGDFKFFDKLPEGGQLIDQQVIWKPLNLDQGGDRVIFLDRLVTEDDEEDTEASRLETDPSTFPKSTVPMGFCRYCGTVHAIAKTQSKLQTRCVGCSRPVDLIPLFAVRQKSKHPGKLTSCVTCGALGRFSVGGFREPTRNVRAVAVSDVHVLAQNMIHHAEHRRLLVFADNRQDAAFQAGWMQDHARRYRLRSLMYDRIQKGAVSIGDLTAHLDHLLEADDELSRTLVPEVWRVHRKESEGVYHNQQRKRFLRIQVLREVVTGVKQRIGLEPWGRMQVEYAGLVSTLPFIDKWAKRLRITPDLLMSGVASLLDVTRRGSLLLDQEERIFSRFWQEGDFEIQRGYLPLLQGVPKALKLQREPGDDKNRVQQWLSDKGDTLARQAAKRWGVTKDDIPEFFEELWQLLTEELRLLVPVTLTGWGKKAVPRCAGVRQIDADKLRLTPHRGIYRCNLCRRTHIRPTPHDVCMAWRCKGNLEFERESGDDYDLMVLDQQFATIRPREHSAQVPAAEREILELMFKGKNEQVNTLVCTPTLELGVNIGALDAVLMRNVPPLPANYWQRAGRAGREHRMAVNLTYARQASHDRAYFNEPLKLLQGLITPPRFNLRNNLMVQKHVHATILMALHQLAAKSDPDDITPILKLCFPSQVKKYLFDENGHVRLDPLDVSCLTTLISQYEVTLFNAVQQVFSQGWPTEAQAVITDSVLQNYITNMGEKLTEVITRLWRRLQWALAQVKRLEAVRERKGTLDLDEDALRQRCDRLVKRLKGIQSRRKREAEGYDDTNTYSVLASEGFLPGYGLEVGSVLGTAQVPPGLVGISDFELSRPVAIALREYIPGNLIYANGNRFVPRFYHLEPQQQITLFQVDVANEAISEIGISNPNIHSSLRAAALQAVPICDVDLPHQSHITDEEDYRFQLAVSVMGYEQHRHSGGKAFHWGEKTLQLRSGVHLRLVNVGAANLVYNGTLGYPVCVVCGQSRSPLASQADRDNFASHHKERCGQSVENIGFFADVVADALSIQDCANREEAYSIAEAIRVGASLILDMELEDLQVLAIAHPGLEKVDVLLYDPMPGGSGLLEQIIDQWPEITSAALGVVQHCPSACNSACIDCLFTYRNSYYHRYLNRHQAVDKLNRWGHHLSFSHEIPPKLPNLEKSSEQQPVNNQETRLQKMLESAGFSTPIAQHPIELGKPLGTTTVDFYYEDPSERSDGICIYLDGMSRHLHGDPERHQRDRIIREELRNRSYEVFEIPVGSLDDCQAMKTYFFRIARILLGKAAATEIRDNSDWFEG